MKRKIWLFALCNLVLVVVKADVTLPKLISNGMILQRDQKVRLWGWASPGEDITIEFNGQKVAVKCPESQKWEISLAAMKAGGPYQMTIKGKNTIVLQDVLLGDVWLCSGQSNMDFPLYRSKELYKDEIASSTNSQIREFSVKTPDSYAQHKDIEKGAWKSANPKNVPGFSAVGYFFALNLHQKYKVPIGIIHSSYSGSPAEAWISDETLKKYPHYLKKAAPYRDEAYTKAALLKDKQTNDAWFAEVNKNDKGLSDRNPIWSKPDLDTRDWKTLKVPGVWEDQGIDVDGVVWLRKTVNVPAAMLKRPVTLELGLIDDIDTTYMNGVALGTKDNRYLVRRYDIPAGLLKTGENTIAVRVVDKEGKGGIIAGKQYRLTNGEQNIDLTGDWHYKVGHASPPLPVKTFLRLGYMPGIQYHSKILPIAGYTIKGVTWYQGEANTGKPEEYKILLPDMIKDWRKLWGQGNFPFLIVQLANYMAPPIEPQDGGWPRLREAQAFVANVVPHTGLAIAIDIGETNDIHPLNKKDVGHRLALSAYKVAYGDEKAEEPVTQYEKMNIDANKIIVSFKNLGKGLQVKNAALKQFAIAGADKKFYWAKAIVKNGKVEVWSDKVAQPIAVRYAWADNPEGSNLYNLNGLPVAPFRTDAW